MITQAIEDPDVVYWVRLSNPRRTWCLTRISNL